jgi:hypothetical protein
MDSKAYLGQLECEVATMPSSAQLTDRLREIESISGTPELMYQTIRTILLNELLEETVEFSNRLWFEAND